MKFTNYALTLAASIAGVSAVGLYVESSDSTVNGLTLSSVHEGAGINYFFLGSGGSQDLNYDASSKSLYVYLSGRFKQALQFSAGILQLSVTSSDDTFTFSESDYLERNGKIETYYACKNFGDPYSYSNSEYGILTEKKNGECIDVKIKVNGVQVVESDTTVTTTFCSDSTTEVATVVETVASTTTETTSCSDEVTTITSVIEPSTVPEPASAVETEAPATETATTSCSDEVTTITSVVEPTTIVETPSEEPEAGSVVYTTETFITTCSDVVTTITRIIPGWTIPAIVTAESTTEVAATTTEAAVTAGPTSIDWSTVSYDVDWSTVSYDVDWSTVSYPSTYNVNWTTVSYNVDWKTVSYDVDWNTVSYDVDWNTVSYDVDWNTVQYKEKN